MNSIRSDLEVCGRAYVLCIELEGFSSSWLEEELDLCLGFKARFTMELLRAVEKHLAMVFFFVRTEVRSDDDFVC